MFLTTNQIAQLGVAIPSRINIALSYGHLKPNQMDHIIRGFIEPPERHGLVDGIMKNMQYEVYENNFDGRQRRNIVTTVLGLARAEAKAKKYEGRLA